MNKRRKKHKKAAAQTYAQFFADTLSDYEETMGEGAAMALLCEQEGMDIEDGYMVLADLPDDEP